MKLRLSSLLVIGLAGACGYVLFKTSQNVQDAESRARRLAAALEKERDAIRVLETEWDYLNRPDRIEGLVRQHLNMDQPAPAALVRDSGDVPRRIIPLPAHKPSAPLRNAAITTDNQPQIPRENPAPQDTRRHFNDLLNSLTLHEPASGGPETGAR